MNRVDRVANNLLGINMREIEHVNYIKTDRDLIFHPPHIPTPHFITLTLSEYRRCAILYMYLCALLFSVRQHLIQQEGIFIENEE